MGSIVARWVCVLAAAIAWAVPCSAVVPQLRIEAGEHSAGIRRIAVSADQRLIATAGDDKTARLWRAADRRLLAVLRVPIGEGDEGRLYGVAFSPDDRHLAVAGTGADPQAAHRIDVFSVASGEHQRTLGLDAGHVVRLLWLRDGRHLAACLSGSDGLRIVGVDEGRVVYAETFAAPCFGLAELADGSLLASGFDGAIRHLRLDDGTWRRLARIRTEPGDPQAIAVSPDGRHYAVGYRSRLPSGHAAVDVFEASRHRLHRRFVLDRSSGGSLGAVAWTRDGRSIAAAGRAEDGRGGFLLMRIRWPEGTSSTDVAAPETIQDLAAFGDDRIAVASSSGTWNVVGASGPVQPLPWSVIALRGADALAADPALRTLGFGDPGSGAAFVFDLQRRLLQPRATGAREPPRRAWPESAPAVVQWEDHRGPRIAGRAVAMDGVEISRAVAPLADGVLLGTSRTLRRFDREGTQRWSVRTIGEVRALRVREDGLACVAAHADGVLRWWRTTDGALLLSLFVSPDGRWVVWTEQGYYDAGPGAESLIGWHVERDDGSGADFHSIGRFRDRFHRPDVVDRVLQTLDARLAVEVADAARKEHVAAEDAVAAAAPLVADPHAQALPPVLFVHGGATDAVQAVPPDGDRRTLSVQFTIRSGKVRAGTLLVRVNGRPAEPSSLVMPAQQDGRAPGRLVVPMPQADAEVAVMAESQGLLSDPVYLSWKWRPPPASTAKPATAASPPSPRAEPSARLYVVAVGVSEYARKEYSLALAAKDATDFHAVLAAQGGGLYASVESRLLVDAKATRSAVLDALEWLRRSVGPKDTGVLFIAGHGVNDAKGQYFFLPHDADLQRLGTTAVGDAQLRATLSSLRGRAMLFADTCHAGNVVGRGSAASAEIGRLANTLASADSGVIVFSASTGRQEAIEHQEWGNGAFTRALVQGLRGAADFRNEGVVTHQGLSYFLGQEVRRLTANRQTPVTAVPLGVVDYPMVAVGRGS